MLSKFSFYFSLVLLSLFPLIGCSSSEAKSPYPKAIVYKGPTCNCCDLWIDHMKANGFNVKGVNDNNLRQTKKELGIPNYLSACHTAKIGDYIIEGHIPADVVKQFLKEKSDMRGLAVPGMPVGSPGMEGPDPETYKVYAFKKGKKTTVYETIKP